MSTRRINIDIAALIDDQVPASVTDDELRQRIIDEIIDTINDNEDSEWFSLTATRSAS